MVVVETTNMTSCACWPCWKEAACYLSPDPHIVVCLPGVVVQVGRTKVFDDVPAMKPKVLHPTTNKPDHTLYVEDIEGAQVGAGG